MSSNHDQMTVTQLQQESARLEGLISETERSLADLKSAFGQVRDTLSRRLRPSPEPRLSDHALLRFRMTRDG